MTAPSPGRRVAARSITVAAVAALVLLAGCSGSSDAGDATPTTTGRPTSSTSTTTTQPPAKELAPGDDLYAVPDPLPDLPHGTLLRYQEVPDSRVKGGTTYRILYLSESLQGKPIAVSGTAIVPDTAAPEGGRPVLTVAHGTTGVADECAPSKDPGSELLLLGTPIESGWLIAFSDYEGLGTPGRHPYLVGPSEGRSVLDAATAATALPDADAGDRLAIAGYSQGGHGALWANQLAESWAPQWEVVGTFAGAPATEMEVILRGGPSGFVFMNLAGLAAAYPQLDLATYLTPAGLDRIGAVDTGCAADVFAAVSSLPKDQAVRPDALDHGDWKKIANENDPGRVATDDPILIIHSEADSTVPVILSQFLLTRMCEHGQVVERRVLHDGDAHTAAAVPAYRQAVEWLEGRFADDPPDPVDSCQAEATAPTAATTTPAPTGSTRSYG